METIAIPNNYYKEEIITVNVKMLCDYFIDSSAGKLYNLQLGYFSLYLCQLKNVQKHFCNIIVECATLHLYTNLTL